MHHLDALPILILYPHSRCNCRCVMCDIWKIESVEEIGETDLERHWQHIQNLGVRWVVFSGGEPLMHSDLFRLSGRLRTSGIRTTALSTGLLLSKQAGAIAGGMDDLILSLDGPADAHDRIRRIPRAFEMLELGVKAVLGVKPDFPIAARCTVQKGNASHLRRTVSAVRNLGLCSISFLAADLTSSAFNRPRGWSIERQSEVALTPDEISILEKEIDGLIDDAATAPGFVLESPEKLRRIIDHFRAFLGLTAPVAPRCNAPWVSAVMESDGLVRPCFFHAPYGSAREQSLIDVLNSPKAVEFRKSLDMARNPVCRRCVCSLYYTHT